MDVKYVVSRDDGKSWSTPGIGHARAHRNYLPGVMELLSPSGPPTFLMQWADYSSDGYLVARGRLEAAR